jgi:methanogenic corrinoid protein MtbC1
MDLLFQNMNGNLNKLAQKVYDRHFQLDPKLEFEYNDRQKRSMYKDIFYNLEYLNTAIEYEDQKIFVNYAVWLYYLLCNLIKNLEKERIRDQMIMHYELLIEVLKETLAEEEYLKASYYLNYAIEATKDACIDFHVVTAFEVDEYYEMKKEYLENLLSNDTYGAYEVIHKALNSGVSINNIFQNVLQEVLYEIGNLWHQNKITVDIEHYCTATTQMLISQFYPIIFSKPKNGFKVLACCVGSELHEIGIRMVADLFEYNGWESIYLGASVPKEDIFSAITDNKPHLVALSVTMPQHLQLCHEVVKDIRKKYKSLKIAVGGGAFKVTDKLWEKWPVDVYSDTADELIEWAFQNIVRKKVSRND